MDLSPVVAALLHDARTDADALSAAARSEAEEQIAAARADAQAERERARREGIAEAEAQLAVERARSRRSARERVLAARREVWEELRHRVRRAAAALRDAPDYPALLARLAAVAREQLGEEARVVPDPDGAAGLLAESGDRRVDYRLEVVAERCLRELGPEVEELWR